jgi:alpha-1,4-galacturonosyltransferase
LSKELKVKLKLKSWSERERFVHGIKEMKFYISAKGIKRVTISNGGGKGSGKDTTAVAGGNPAGSVSSGRRISLRTVLPVVLVLGILLPFVFVRVAILVLESATFCSSLGNSHSSSFFTVR